MQHHHMRCHKGEMQILENMVARYCYSMFDLDLLEEFGQMGMDVGHTGGHRKKYLQAFFLYWNMKMLYGWKDK